MHVSKSVKVSLQSLFPIIVILLVSLYLRVDKLDTLPPGISNDEAVDVIDAFHISRSGTFPLYEDVGRPEDYGRPEPLFRIIQAVGVLLLGPSIWSFRLISVFMGVLTIAAAYQTIRQCLRDYSPRIRYIAALAGASALTITISHIVLSRSTYLTVAQPFFTLLFINFLLHGLYSKQKRSLIASAICLAAALYTYTAALVVPAVLLAVGLSLLIWQRQLARIWLPRLIIIAAVTGVLMIPVGIRLLTHPETVIGRALQVRGQFSLAGWESELITHFFVQGDINPQYNVAQVPILPPLFTILFVIGLIALLFRIKQPSTAAIATLLIVSPIPVIASNESLHGLRIAGAYPASALLIGLGTGFLCWVVIKFTKASAVVLVIAISSLALLLFGNAVYAQNVYFGYWQNQPKWNMYGLNLDNGEWFFRTDRRDLVTWINSQNYPMLIPANELSQPATRSWLMSHYADIKTTTQALMLPDNTHVVIPWSLESGSLRLTDQQYVLLDHGTITILPPLTLTDQALLTSNIDQSKAIQRQGTISLLGRVKPLPDRSVLDFVPEQTIGIDFENEIKILGVRGPETLNPLQTQAVTYTLDLAALHRLGHDYCSFVQLATQDYHVISGQDVHIWRWLYPTTMWNTQDTVPTLHQFTIPDTLQPGAYRLLAGIYNYVNEPLSAFSPTDTRIPTPVTIAWVKVPQKTTPTVPANAYPIDAVFADTFHLESASSALAQGKVQISLYWESLQERPNLDATIFIHVLDKNGKLVTQQDTRPLNGQYPTFIWSKGELVETNYSIDLPPGVKSYTLVMGMYTTQGQVRLQAVQADQRVPQDLINLDSEFF